MSANLMRKFSGQLSATSFKRLMNLWPLYQAAGIKIDYISRDFRNLHVSMNLHWYNSNYVGTHFGGSLYAMADPFYMLLIMQNLGDNYIVWDQAAQIRFRKPGKGKVSALFQINDLELSDMRATVESLGKTLFKKSAQVRDKDLNLIAEIDKVVYIRKK